MFFLPRTSPELVMGQIMTEFAKTSRGLPAPVLHIVLLSFKCGVAVGE
jgi:hypothetical protein